MAAIEDLIARRFTPFVTPEIVFSKLDLGILHVAKTVEVIHDLVVHPGDDTADVDQVAALTVSLLAYLGHLGRMVDALEDDFRSARSAAQAPEDRG